ncbi:MAG: hypothetical protein GOVbin2950_28 [Prokaryotic dsDNA virus sp.]|nr:MAG: hypothetical protein GOVbin2950_28 [Prokaryotic dsDNA virus sp.]|tara:strand:- start:877 stop:1350 length:474 start_codon:yes stop_codon:yes gene_type:complete
MSNQGVRGYYQVTDILKTNLLNDENVNTVTTGDITDIDLSKQTIFPLSHIIINSVEIQEQVLNFNLTVMCMDIVDVSKDETTDIFRGNNNEQDILNTQLAVANKLVGLISKGTLYQDKYQIEGTATCEFFYERFENQLAGVACTFSLLIANDINVCS